MRNRVDSQMYSMVAAADTNRNAFLALLGLCSCSRLRADNYITWSDHMDMVLEGSSGLTTVVQVCR